MKYFYTILNKYSSLANINKEMFLYEIYNPIKIFYQEHFHSIWNGFKELEEYVLNKNNF